MGRLHDLRTRWRIAKVMADAQARGEALIRVPGPLADQVRTYAWQLRVESAVGRWAVAEQEVSIDEWRATMSAHYPPKGGRHRG